MYNHIQAHITTTRKPWLSFLEPILFSFVKQIRFGGPQIHNFWTSVPILFLLDAFATVIGIGDSWITANDTAPFKGSVIAFIANMYECMGIDKRVANNAFAVAYHRRRKCRT